MTGYLVPLASRATETTDIKVVNVASLAGLWDDWLFTSGRLDETEALANLVKVAFLTDRRSGDGEILPDPDSDDRRGWWGNYQAEEIWDGWPIGCKNWLLLRSKIVGSAAEEGSTLARVEQYCREALAPLVEKRICTHFDIEVERTERQRIDATIVIYRGPKKEIVLRFQDLWSEIRE